MFAAPETGKSLCCVRLLLLALYSPRASSYAFPLLWFPTWLTFWACLYLLDGYAVVVWTVCVAAAETQSAERERRQTLWHTVLRLRNGEHFTCRIPGSFRCALPCFPVSRRVKCSHLRAGPSPMLTVSLLCFPAICHFFLD